MTLRSPAPACLFLCAVFLLPPAATPAPQQTAAPAPILTLAEYQAGMERLAAEMAATAGDEDAVNRLRSALPETWVVATGDGEISVPSAALAKTLEDLALLERWQRTRDQRPQPRQSPRELGRLKGLLDRKLTPDQLRAQLAARLDAMAGHARALGEAGETVALEDARARLEQILGRREFAASSEVSWLEQMRQRLMAWLAGLLGKFFGRVSAVPGLGDLLFWGLLALVFTMLALFTLRMLSRARRGAALALGQGPPLPMRSQDWLRQALAAARRQDWRQALHGAYWAGVYRLAEAGAWEIQRDRTAREYLRLLSLEHDHRRPLAALTERFEVTWYGYRPARETDFREALAELEKIGCLPDSHPATASS